MSSDRDVVLRVHRDRNYKTVHLYAVQDDRELSWKAAGILWYLISRPNRWEFRVADLIARHTDGKVAVQAGLKELGVRGYLHRVKDRGQGGHFGGWVWHISEVPLDAVAWEEAISSDDRQPQNLSVGRRAQNPTVGKPDGRETSTTSNKKEANNQQDLNMEEGETTLPPDGGLIVLSEQTASAAAWMMALWHEELGSGRTIVLTPKRSRLLVAMFAEHLDGLPDAALAWRAILVAVKRSEFHMGNRDYQFPESFLRNAESRDRWVEKAAIMVEGARNKSTEAVDFAAAYRSRQQAGGQTA